MSKSFWPLTLETLNYNQNIMKVFDLARIDLMRSQLADRPFWENVLLPLLLTFEIYHIFFNFSFRPNFFILDEPTNHLDIETVEALGKALQKFNVRTFSLWKKTPSLYLLQLRLSRITIFCKIWWYTLQIYRNSDSPPRKKIGCNSSSFERTTLI